MPATQIGNVWKSSFVLVLQDLIKTTRPLILVCESEHIEDILNTLNAFELNTVIISDSDIESFKLNAMKSNSEFQSDRLYLVSESVFMKEIEVEHKIDSVDLAQGQKINIGKLTENLIGNGFERITFIEKRNQFALRGSVIDIFDMFMKNPIRIETAFDSIDSIREFSIETKLSIDSIKRTQIIIPDRTKSTHQNFYNLIPKQATVIFINYDRLKSDLELKPFNFNTIQLYEQPIEETESSKNLKVYSLNSLKGSYLNKGTELEQVCDAVKQVIVFCKDESHNEKIMQLIASNNIQIKNGIIWESFRTDDTAYVSSFDLLGKQYSPKPETTFKPADLTNLFFDFQSGDFVVHKYLGIGRYIGLNKVKRDTFEQERLVLEFHNDVRYLLPLHEIDLVHKYYACDDSPVTLTNIKSDHWLLTRLKARDDIRKFAAELINQHAKRIITKRTPYFTDRDLTVKFAESFEYEDTDCQSRVWKEIEIDIDKDKPMDRLICADVGFGKTEIACRTAFKVAVNGKQVALICPTTILAYQHFLTFKRRMKAFPVNIELLSRFLSRSEQREVIEKLTAGETDVVIGTHRLLQNDVTFKNLGLIIIDEEQRFGVEHKSKIHSLKSNVDVLTLTATPIPRTLHMGLSGLKDISILHTPPKNRRPIKTKVAKFSKDLIKQAIETELKRDGQVFILHNNIGNLEHFLALITGISGNAKCSIIHGQLDEEEIEIRLLDFMDRKYQILIATTIIENGIDIPNANTLIVTDSFRYGLSQLHQIRGRIGRENRQGFAYFLFQGELQPQAVERLKALEEFSDLGAGFKIALRDLELRGAGNLIGREQHGHVRAIGYDLYVQFLNQEISKIKEGKESLDIDPDIYVNLPALIPGDLIPSENDRLKIYKEIFNASTEDELAKTEHNLRDLLGNLSDNIENLFLIQKLKILLKNNGIIKLNQMKNGVEIQNINGEKTFFITSIEKILASPEQLHHHRVRSPYFS
ncbi:MAG: DEAD/DEAH box helicase [Planctomycetes bacterium]|nr:DEAD/DEAH box helicase [Planctomycetota bacterium]